ncbi:MAG: cysteine desulfurase family protein [Patescibacteria group bacterium]
MEDKKNIYLDNAATTKVDRRVLEAMRPYFSEQYGNASSLHQPGLDARVAVDRAQAKIASFLGCQKEEVYFTSGATESDNMAILGLIRALDGQAQKKSHLIVSKIEHDAILEPAKQLAKEGVEVTFLPVNKKGLVEVEQLRRAVKVNTVLVSIMYVNNELGTIQPIKEIGQLIGRLNKKRGAGKNKIYFHTDAVQALSYCDCQVEKLGVDLLSLSGHKIYGPKGVGAIYIRRGTPLKPLLFGGHQQEGVRSGTYNVPSIVGLGRAVELLLDERKLKTENERIKKLRDSLIKGVRAKVSGILINGDLAKRVPSNASFIFKGVEGESVVLLLSEKGIAVSTGSACSSGSLEPSHVLKALGIKPELAHGSLRVTLGRFTSQKDIRKFLKELPSAVARLRKISPFK